MYYNLRPNDSEHKGTNAPSDVSLSTDSLYTSSSMML